MTTMNNNAGNNFSGLSGRIQQKYIDVLSGNSKVLLWVNVLNVILLVLLIAYFA